MTELFKFMPGVFVINDPRSYKILLPGVKSDTTRFIQPFGVGGHPYSGIPKETPVRT